MKSITLVFALAALAGSPSADNIAAGSVTITGTETLTSTVRLDRNGVGSVWGTQKPFPGLVACGGGTCYFQTVAVNPGPFPSIQVTLTGSSYVFAAAYLDSFSTSDLAANYLGDSGQSDGSSFQVTVPQGHQLILFSTASATTSAHYLIRSTGP